MARLMLLDTAALYFRAFYGVPDTVRSPDGRPVNAVRGLLDIIARLVAHYRPTDLVACWDDDWRPAWRVDLIPSYKAHRVAEEVEAGPDVEVVSDPLEAQVPVIRETLSVLGIAVAGAPEHEADDVIGTLATTASMPVDVVTGDRDLFQLVDDARQVRVIYTARGMANLEVVTDGTVVARYGIRPDQYADFAALRGDPSDGLPGVAGVGEKTAAALLTAHGDLAGVVAAARAGEGMTPRVRASILAALPYLEVAPDVVRVVRDLDVDPAATRLPAPDAAARESATALGERWGLGASITRLLAALDGAAAS